MHSKSKKNPFPAISTIQRELSACCFNPLDKTHSIFTYFIHGFLLKLTKFQDFCSCTIIFQGFPGWVGNPREFLFTKQECIPVGCVPAARRPSAGVCIPGEVCLVWGGSAWSGGGGVCLVPGGVSDPGGLPGLGGALPGRGGALSGPGGGWCVWPGGGIPACTEADTPPPPRGQTHACKNITLATTSLRPVINRTSPPGNPHYCTNHATHCELTFSCASLG